MAHKCETPGCKSVVAYPGMKCLICREREGMISQIERRMDMPAYYLCPQCKRTPVSRCFELCDDCKEQAERSQREYDRKLKELERKPRGGREWLKEMSK